MSRPRRHPPQPTDHAMTPRGRPAASALVQNVRESLESGRYAGRDAVLIVGVSGGPDSTALLSSLVQLREECRLDLLVVHIDHGLREESRSDAAYVRRLCARWNIPVTVRRVDVQALRDAEGLSIEEAARAARHSAFVEEADWIGADAIALGHTADDQVETVLLNVLRGAGLRGLAGMREQSESPFPSPNKQRVPIIRPLLAGSRADVMAYLKERRLRPRHDPSNADPAHLRNRIRHELIPLMETLREGATEAVGRVAADARTALDFIEDQVAGLWNQACETAADGQSIQINCAIMRDTHPALRHAVADRAISTLIGSTEGFSRRNFAAIDSLITDGRTGAEITLPHGLFLARINHNLAVLSLGTPPVPLPELAPATLALNGVTAAGGWDVRCDDSGRGDAPYRHRRRRRLPPRSTRHLHYEPRRPARAPILCTSTRAGRPHPYSGRHAQG